ncbi:MAG: alpha/beta fold hydrolase, partial [Kiritimatiellia bacterium]
MEIISQEKAAGSTNYRDTIKLTYKSYFDGRQDWALLEKSTGKAGKIWVVLLHGHGSAGNQIYTRKDVATTWLPAIRERGLSILAPNLRGNAWMCKAAVEDLHALIEYARWKLDAEKFVIVSGSMGGTGALIYTVNYPWEIAGVCALCPATDIARYWKFCAENGTKKAILGEIGAAIEKAYGGTPSAAPAAYEDNSALARAGRFDMPVFLAHGDNDAIIPVEESRTFAAALEKSNKKFIYTELNNGHHDSPIPEAVRGLDWILKENPALAVAEAPVIDAALDRGDAVYRCGEIATAVFTMQSSGAGPATGSGTATIALEDRTEISTTNISWTAVKPVALSGTLKEPGFLRFSVKFDLPGGKAASAFCVAGFDPEKIKPATQCPADFRSFWEAGRKKLGRPEVTLEKIDKFSSPLVNAYLLSFPNLDGWTTYGFLVIPKGSRKYPALVRVCDGGAGAASPWVSRPDAIGLTLVVHNFRPAFDHLEMMRHYEDYNRPHGGSGWHMTHGVPDREKYYYRYAILGADY